MKCTESYICYNRLVYAMATATYDETYESLMRITKTVTDGMFELGKIRGKNAFGSEEELKVLVIDISKKLLESLPAHQFEDDEVDHLESCLSHKLSLLEDPNQFRNNDFEVVG